MMNFGRGRSEIVLTHTARKTIRFEYSTVEAVLDLKPEFLMAHTAAVVDASASEKAARLRHQTRVWDKKSVDSCVYIAGPISGAVKIGTSKNPLSRLNSLRRDGGDLRFFGLVWVLDGRAYELERGAHRIAATLGEALENEFFDIEPDEAAVAILLAAREGGVACCDSKTMIHNWRRRALALKEARPSLNWTPEKGALKVRSSFRHLEVDEYREYRPRKPLTFTA